MFDVVEKCKELCESRGGHKLLYITMYGSHLYGTAGPDSDKDYKFIFLPNKDFLLTGNRIKHITYESGSSDQKNTKYDFDVQGWSLQYFCELLAKGETNALDVLYSCTNPDAVVFENPSMNRIFLHHSKFYNLKGVKSFLGYANAQAKKYGIKGKRLKVFKNILDDSVLDFYKNDDYKLGDFIQYIITHYGDKNNCNIKYQNDERFLHINGSFHLPSIKLSEFLDRIKQKYQKYGFRSEQAMISEGEDYKALSHAYRCFIQYEQLVTHGFITFPLYKHLEFVKKIKDGNVDSKVLYDSMKEYLDYLESFDPDTFENKYDRKYVEKIILSFYK